MKSDYLKRRQFFKKILELLLYSRLSTAVSILCISLTVFSRILQYELVHATSALIDTFSSSDNSSRNANSKNISKFIILVLSCACTTSIHFYAKVSFLNYIAKIIEIHLMRLSIYCNYDEAFKKSPTYNIQRVNRQTEVFRSIIESLIFDLFSNLISVLRILYYFFKTFERKFIFELLCILVIMSIFGIYSQYFIFEGKLKTALRRNEENIFTEINDICSNLVMCKVSDENDYGRVKILNENKVYLKHMLAKNVIKSSIIIILVMAEIYILINSRLVWISFTKFLSCYSLLINDFIKIIEGGIKIEEYRLDVSKLGEPIADKLINKSSSVADCGILQTLKLQNIRIQIKNKIILENINLDFAKNDVIAVVGPNGSGKSVFFKFLLGLMEYSGDVIFNGKRATPLDIKNSNVNKIGYCPPNHVIIKGTILSNIIENPNNIVEINNANMVLKRYYVDCIFNSMQNGYETEISNNSDIQILQLVNIMRALIYGKSIVLLDEPMSYVSGDIGEKIIDKIIENTEDRLVLIILHDFYNLKKFKKILKFGDNKSAKLFNSYEDYLASENN